MDTLRRIEPFAVPLVALALTGFAVSQVGVLTTASPDFDNGADHQKYIYMAQRPFTLHVAPYAWRVGVPLLVRALPFDIQLSFFLVAFIGVWLAGVGVFYLARSFSLSTPLAWLGVLLFYSLAPARFPLFDFWLPDGLSFALIVLALILAKRRALIPFALVVALAALVKESVLFALPLFYTLNAERAVDWRAARSTALAAAPAVLIVVLVRALIPAYNHDPAYMASLDWRLTGGWAGNGIEGIESYSYLELTRGIVPWRIRSLSLISINDYVLSPLGITAIIPWLAPRQSARLLARFSPFLLAVGAQLLVAYDTDRLLVLAFPATILLSLSAISHLTALSTVLQRYKLRSSSY